jgi:hypothetical protein
MYCGTLLMSSLAFLIPLDLVTLGYSTDLWGFAELGKPKSEITPVMVEGVYSM